MVDFSLARLASVQQRTALGYSGRPDGTALNEMER